MILVAQTTYTALEVGLHDGAKLITQRTIDKKDACAQLIPTIDTLLSAHNGSHSHIEKIMVNIGPAPFTSLRTLIATVNGIAFASNVPLYGSSALAVMSHMHASPNKPLLVILNAYNKEFYYGLTLPGKPIQLGCGTLDTVLQLATLHGCIIVGHIAQLSQAETVHDLKQIDTIEVAYCTLAELAAYTLAQIKTGMTATKHLSPTYIKDTMHAPMQS